MMCMLYSLPYRMVYAVASQNAIVLYDTQSTCPFGYISNIHYASLTDLTWYNINKYYNVQKYSLPAGLQMESYWLPLLLMAIVLLSHLLMVNWGYLLPAVNYQLEQEKWLQLISMFLPQ